MNDRERCELAFLELKKAANGLGLRVIVSNPTTRRDRKLGYIAGYYNGRRTITIMKNMNRRPIDLLFTLAHEMGHAIFNNSDKKTRRAAHAAYRIFNEAQLNGLTKEVPRSVARRVVFLERRADEIGRSLLGPLLRRRKGIRRSWKSACRDNIRNYEELLGL